MLAVLPASHRLRLSDLRNQLGDNVEMAKESEIHPLFPDCARGAVPPLGHCYALPLIVDDGIEAQPEIYMKAGDHGVRCSNAAACLPNAPATKSALNC
ncbi:MAG TPA: YbaK/EbsC family protein [Steroidobacteraceae bacterium]